MVLIDRKKLEEQIKEAFKANPSVMGMLLHWIRRQKAVDAVPVVHGEWIIHVDELFPADSTQECSVCHGEEWLGIKHENYCPNCGAKMDGVRE